MIEKGAYQHNNVQDLGEEENFSLLFAILQAWPRLWCGWCVGFTRVFVGGDDCVND